MDKGGGANVGDDGASVLNNYDNKKIKKTFFRKSLTYRWYRCW